MANESVAAANAGLAAKLVPGTTYYQSLHTAAPGATGANEFTTVTRQAIVMGTPSAGVQANTSATSIPNGGTQTAAYEGLWTLATGGVFVSGAPLTTPSTGTPIAFPIGSVTRNES